MKIQKVIACVDEWQPNLFPVEDKLRWCYEVTGEILVDCPEFQSYEKEISYDGGVMSLPEGVQFSDVARVYRNGKQQVIRDERTLSDTVLKKGDVVNVVYRVIPEEYALVDDAVPEELETICPAPWDAMYIDYVCAQIAFQQNDLEDYEKFISRYNVRFEAYKKWFGSNSPVSDRKRLVNYY